MTQRIVSATLVCGLLVAGAGWAAVQPINLVLTGTAPNYSCTANPELQQVNVGDTVKFHIGGNQTFTGQAVKKTGSTTNFKFGTGQNDFKGKGNTDVTTGAVSGKADDVWSYDVNYYDANNNLICHADPDICIKNASGGCSGVQHGHGHGKPEGKPTPTPHPR
jgi:hypothetical protein